MPRASLTNTRHGTRACVRPHPHLFIHPFINLLDRFSACRRLVGGQSDRDNVIEIGPIGQTKLRVSEIPKVILVEA